jgi:predicted DNA-binding protein
VAKSRRPEWKLIRLSAEQAARVDAWAATHGKRRSEAVRDLVEFALKQEMPSAMLPRDRVLEQLAESQIDRLIDPGTPFEERERRIHRLTEGPPEFVGLRLDLPGRKQD